MTDFKVGDTVALFGTVTCVDKSDAALPYRVSYEDGSFVWARNVVPAVSRDSLLAENGNAIDELRDDIDRANTLIGALEHLLAAEREVSRVDRLLSAYKRALQAAEDGYRKARDSFDRASSESDTNGGESK